MSAQDPTGHARFLPLLWVYLAAIGVGVLTVVVLPGDWHPALTFGLADVVATLVVFAFSRAWRNSSMYDPYWSVAPMVIAVALWPIAGGTLRLGLATLLVWLWGARLTWNFLRRWRGMQDVDWRYQDLAKQHGRAFWWVSLGGIHMMPTVLVFAGCLPLFWIAVSPAPFGLFDVAGLTVALVGIGLETVADQQLRRYLDNRPASEPFLRTGLWAHSRHANYLGEILFWWGLALLGLAAHPEAWWLLGGALAINLLFVFISIPMIDRRMREKKPGYTEFSDRVPGLVPRPWRRAG